MEGKIKRAPQYHMKDLNLQVRLETCVDGNYFDMTGRKVFEAEFFRENIGFGISNINIEVNPSLQPIVEITFRDIYGNTTFGSQDRSSGYDYSVLFDWPPPKFLLTFKGYLGRPVTWILNLKKHDIEHIASEGVVEIKCSFVPNQWGFFADIPFLYLLAVKRLKKDEKGLGSEELSKIQTIFDYIKIGKQVNVKTQETTKQFDGLLKQVTSLRTSPVNALLISKLVKFDEEITGEVNGIQVQNFQPITVQRPEGFSDARLKDLSNSGNNQRKVNMYIILSSKIGTNGKSFIEPISNVTGSDLITSFQQFNENDINYRNEYDRRIKILDSNIEAINTEIQRRVYDSSKSQLQKLTISEVFSRLSKDAAYILGKILDAGVQGYSANITSRDNPENARKLIGKAFPLIIDENGVQRAPISGAVFRDGEQSQQLQGDEFGVAEYEMKFVDAFIEAISEGIANNQDLDEINAGADDTKLLKRINNLEMLQGNPYKPYYSSIITNILIRSGIGAYMTRSHDPNLPGGFGASALSEAANSIVGGNDTREDMNKLAESEAKNFSDNSILKSTSEEDLMKLKRFAKFFNRLLSFDGEHFLDASGNEIDEYTTSNGTIVPLKFQEDPNQPVDNSILDYLVLMERPFDLPTNFGIPLSNEALNSQQVLQRIKEQLELGNNSLAGFEILSVREFFKEFQDLAKGTALQYINPSTLTASRIISNGIPYFWPTVQQGKYWYVMFQGDDANRVTSINSSDTDSEFSSEEDSKDNDEGAIKKFFSMDGQPEPLGVVKIDTFKDEEGEVLGRVNIINEAIQENRVLDYSAMINALSRFPNMPAASFTDFLWTKEIVDEELVSIGTNQERANNIAYTVYSEQDETKLGAGISFLVSPTIAGLNAIQGAAFPPSTRDSLVWGPFLDTSSGDRKGRNQRIILKRISKILEDKINEIEEERTKVIGKVLGKAGEQRDLLYHQFHVLFHQWNVLAFSRSSAGGQTFSAEDLCFIPNNGNSNLASELENLYGGTTTTRNENPNDSTFVYQYPYDTIRSNDKTSVPIRVENAIINIDPMYKADSNTTVLNIIQNICQKNNFTFIPVAGNANYRDITDIYKPYLGPVTPEVRNYFHILWNPTPETRSHLGNSSRDPIGNTSESLQFNTDALLVEFGSVDNNIIQNVKVGTQENKVTAESIVNLQRLVDNDNQNKTVTTDCSTLSILEGRSYTANIEVLGNAQVYPMQFFYLDKSPLFGGLYQIMKVQHSISANDMKTSFSGIRMRFTPGAGYGGVPPVTLETLEALGEVAQPNVNLTNEPVEIIPGGSLEDYGELDTPVILEVNTAFANPLDNMIITSPVGNRTPPIGGASGAHHGIDVRAPEGSPLYAITDGIIVEIKIENNGTTSKGYGLRVRLQFRDKDKNVYEALYAHCHAIDSSIIPDKYGNFANIPIDVLTAGIYPGIKVVKGQRIALSGGKKGDIFKGYDLAGTSTGPHLHFEIRKIIKGTNFFGGAQVLNPLTHLPGPSYDLSGQQLT